MLTPQTPAANAMQQQSAPTSTQAPAQATVPTQTPTTNTTTTTVPTQTQQPANTTPTQQAPAPLDINTILSNNSTQDIIPTDSAFNPTLFSNVDNTALMDTISKQTLVTVTPEQIAELGNDPSTISNLLNSTAQQQMSQILQLVPQLIQSGVNDAFSQFTPHLQKQFSANAMNTEVTAGLQDFVSDPLLAPVVKSVASTYLSANPNATSADVNRELTSYFSSLKESMGGGTEASKTKPQAVDWFADLGMANPYQQQQQQQQQQPNGAMPMTAT